jgi:hypothetical protein
MNPVVASAMDPIQSEQSANWRSRRRASLVFLFVGGAVWGAADLLLYDRGFLGKLVSIGFTLLFAIAVMLWCVYDGRLRGFQVTTIWKWFIVLLGIVGVPYFFWQSRPHRECLRSVFGLFLFVAVGAPYYIVWYSLRYALIKVGFYT